MASLIHPAYPYFVFGGPALLLDLLLQPDRSIDQGKDPFGKTKGAKASD